MPGKSTLEKGRLQKFWRFLAYCHFRLLGKRRFNRLVLEKIAGRPFLILPRVFHPKLFRSGEFMIANLDPQKIPYGSKVLDLGTGSGVGAIVAAAWAEHVVAIDINPVAVRCARINVLLNEMEGRVEVREGDLYAPLQDEQFDVVLFNPPYLPGQPQDDLERAFRANHIADRFADGLARHFRPGGYALMVLSSDGDEQAFLTALQRRGFQAEVAVEKDLLREVLRLYRVEHGE